VHGLLALLMSPSLAVKANGWLFMSAIRFGTPTVFWTSE
jgi:hypothetical protein